MTHVTISLPDGALASARKSPDEVASDMRVAVAVRWYAQGVVTQGAAAEIAGMSRSEFLDTLGDFGVSATQETVDEVRVFLRRD
jgi:predicted HTH domain antitoxin